MFFSQMKTINTVLSKNMLHKINKKKRITIRISQGKVQTFQKCSLRKFLTFPADPQKI